MKFSVVTLLTLLSPGLTQSEPVPLVDHHLHLFNTTLTSVTPGRELVTARDAVRALDLAGIRRAAVFSVAYQFGNPNRPAVPDEYQAVKAENDRVSGEVAQFPDRLRGFCSVNPLKDYALDEVARCAKDSHLHYGLKLHFGNSDVQLDEPAHVARVRAVFAAANANRMAIAVHMRPSVTRRRPYTADAARTFLTELLPAAPDVAVQIAHLTGAGGYEDPGAEAAMGVFADAISAHDRRMSRVYFDVSGIAGLGKWRDTADLIVARLRQVGMEQLLFGSDSGTAVIPGPREAWAFFRQLPLTDAEFRTIAGNVAPYMR